VHAILGELRNHRDIGKTLEGLMEKDIELANVALSTECCPQFVVFVRVCVCVGMCGCVFM